MVIIFTLVNSILSAQNFLDKRVLDIDYQNDIQELIELGLNRTDIQFVGFLVVENANKRIDIDTLTVKSYISHIHNYRLTSEYKMMKSISSSNPNEKLDFADSLNVITDYESAKCEAEKTNKPLLIIFAGNMCRNSRELKRTIIAGVFKEYLSNYIVAWLIVDNQDAHGVNNLYLEQSKFNSSTSPYSAIVKDNNIIRRFEGYSTSMINQYIDFLHK